MADDELPRILMATIVASTRSDCTGLNLRQLAVCLRTCLERDIEQPGRGLAAALNISKPAITRAVDRLSAFDLARRERDTIDRRSTIVKRTSAGTAYLQTLDKYLSEAVQT
jgi:DNA-binding MarR family transcriptional regulator